MDYQKLKDELKTYIAERRVIAVVGTGVSLAATEDDRASWLGFLKEGLTLCRSHTQRDSRWFNLVEEHLSFKDTENLLVAAEMISKALEAPNGNRYLQWLRDTFALLEPKRPESLRSLLDLQIPIATTNYDSLIETVSDRTLKPLIWTEENRHLVQRFLTGEERGYVLHLHGYWENASSVVLDSRDYQSHLDNAFAQFSQQLLSTTHRFLFIGCGAGLSDPNFEALRSFMKKLFGKAGHSHYRLARESECRNLQTEHNKAGENIEVISYGSDYDQLPAFLASIAPATIPTSLPRVPRYFQDREGQIEKLVDALLQPVIQPIPIVGGPGMGKTALARKVLQEKQIAQRYDTRRYFVRCDAADSLKKLISAIARELEIPPDSKDIEQRVYSKLSEKPTLLVLDGAEVPWLANAAQAEEYFNSLADIADLALVGTFRGSGYPDDWRERISIDKLEPRFAKSMFFAIAGQRFDKDKWLDDLLKQIGYVPLSVNVLASRAKREEASLENVAEDWGRNFYDLSKIAPEMQKLYASFRTVTADSRMTDEAVKLLSFLGVLPGGIAHHDLNGLLSGGLIASYALIDLGLAVEEKNRLRAYPPVREYAKNVHPPGVEEFKRLSEHYVGLARKHCPSLGRPEAGDAIKLLDAENANIETVLMRGLEAQDAEAAKVCIDTAIELAKLTIHAGIGGTGVLNKARVVAAEYTKDSSREALIWQRLGDIAQLHAQYSEARDAFDHALTLFRQTGNQPKIAECIKSLGDVSLHLSSFLLAEEYFEQAQKLYVNNDDKGGQAECLKRIGDIAREKHRNHEAQQHYQTARNLYEQTDPIDVLGLANCIKALGDVQAAFGHRMEASILYAEASVKYDRVHDVLGIANCCQSLADVASKDSDYVNAEHQFNQALEHFERLDNSLCIAGAHKCFGDMEWKRRHHDSAGEHYRSAARSFERTGNLKGKADCTKSTGDLELDRGNWDLAESYFKQSYQLYTELGIRTMMASCIKGRADIAVKRSDRPDANAKRSDYDNARKLYDEALHTYREDTEERDAFGEAHCLLSLARLELLLARYEPAKSSCSSTIPIFDSLNDWDGLGDCYLILGEAETGLGNQDNARAAFLTAARIFQGHDADRKEKAEGLAAALTQPPQETTDSAAAGS